MQSTVQQHVMRRASPALRNAVRARRNQHQQRLTSTRSALEETNAIVSRVVDQVEQNGDGPLKGLRIAVKDNINTLGSSGLPTTAGSRILSNHASPFEATVVKLLRTNGAIIDSKTNMDEFGMGSHSQHSASGPVKSPYSINGEALSAGGSSGGSAVVVALGEYEVALGTDTGGSVRLPAAYTGVVGFKPSYGLLSRWGVIQYANSLDTVGILANSVANVEKIFGLLDKFDPQDPTSLSESVRLRFRRGGRDSNALRIGIPAEYNIVELSSAVRRGYLSTLQTLRDAGAELVPVSLPSTRQALSAYYVLAPAEASSNLAKYDGIRYGRRSPGPDSSPKDGLPLYAKTRGEGFGPEVKTRILLGTYSLSSDAIDNYFIQAQKVRRLVQRDFDRVFARPHPLLPPRHEPSVADHPGVDVLITPTAPTTPPTIEHVRRQTPVESYMNDVFTVPASLAGLPAVSVPVAGGSAEEGDKMGVQVIGQFGDDARVLETAAEIERWQRAAP